MNSELAGAQAVYLRAPAEGSQRATFTADGDLAIDPDLLADGPDIGRVLVEAGYERGPNPGAFLTPNGIEIDLWFPRARSHHLVTGVSGCPVRAASPRAAPLGSKLPCSTRTLSSSAH